MRSAVRFLVVAIVVLLGSISQAAVINFHGANTESNGSGFGQTLSILVLHDNGNTADNQQSGSVSWNGSADVFDTLGTPHVGGDTVSSGNVHSQTRSVAELTAKGINASNLSVVLNINEAGNGPAINLNDFSLVFLDAGGATLFTALFDSDDVSNTNTDVLNPDGQGQGQSGYSFPVTFQNASELNFFSNSTNRIGLVVAGNQAIGDVSSGAEQFFVNVPEPTSLGLLGLGAIALLRRSRKGSR